VAVYARSQPAGMLSIADRVGLATKEILDAQDEVEAQLREALRVQTAHWGVNAYLVVRDGDPMMVLSEVAREVKADAVIVGSSASPGHRIAGSLALRLVRARRWPVTVVP
jgi:nucleotide-binding universal stress UspA family protein